MREHFNLPTREEIMSQFCDAKYFTKLDTLSGFWRIKLDDFSVLLLGDAFKTQHSNINALNGPLVKYLTAIQPNYAAAQHIYTQRNQQGVNTAECNSRAYTTHS